MSKKKPTREDIDRMKKPYIEKGQPIPKHIERIEKQVEEQESESKKP